MDFDDDLPVKGKKRRRSAHCRVRLRRVPFRRIIDAKEAPAAPGKALRAGPAPCRAALVDQFARPITFAGAIR